MIVYNDVVVLAVPRNSMTIHKGSLLPSEVQPLLYADFVIMRADFTYGKHLGATAIVGLS
jgi:hypothetical protein